ncbi:hypothetical protein [Actinomadura sp. 9N215]|uniref:hypothetical protein n=1 Tax=Actinomadura sp. 9N215 TaxID=3375150 RepID=UPI0037B37674
MIIKPWRISWLLVICGLIWPPYVVLAHWLDDARWWLILIGTIGVGAVAGWGGHTLHRLEFRWPRLTQIVMALGLLMSGGFFGAVIAFVVAPFAGQAGLMPSAALLGLYCLGFAQVVDYGFSGFTLSYRHSGGTEVELRFSAGDDVQG